MKDGTYSFDDGSSPRMRGKLVFSPVFILTSRIIPAHAGQTAAAYVLP